MYTFFDKHGKKFLAVVGSILMIAFIMPSGMGLGNRGGGRMYGQINGKQIDAADVDAAHANLETVCQIIVPGRPQMYGGPAQPPHGLPMDFFPENLVQKFTSEPLLWYLLVEEAARNGSQASEAQIDSLLSSPNVQFQTAGMSATMDKINPTVRESLRPAIRQLQMVETYYIRRREAMEKPTTPMIDDALAERTQQVRVRLATFKASDYEKDIKTPSDEMLRSQFDAYASDEPGVGTAVNPFGFGYKIPDKLQLQWITIPLIDAQRVIESSKSPELWEEDAIMYYQQHPDEFQTPATQPTTKPYNDAKADVLKKIRDPLIDQLQHKVASRIVQQMTADAQRARAAGPTTRAAADASTGYGVPYGSYEYLQKLAAEIEKQFGLKVDTVNQGLPLNQTELQAIGGIGESSLDDTSTASAIGEFGGPAYLFKLCKPLLSEADQNTLGVYDLLSPTKILKSQNALYVVRVLSAEASHPPRSLDEVRPAVEKDVREKLSFSRAAESAQKLVDGATAIGSLDKVGGEQAVQTSDWFGAQNTEIAGVKGITDAFDLVMPIFDMLRGVKSPAELPRRTVIKRQAKGEAVAVELFDVRTTLTTTEAAQMRSMAMQSALRDLITPQTEGSFVTDWFSRDGVSRRIGFVPNDASQPKPGPATPPPGNNPFTPG